MLRLFIAALIAVSATKSTLALDEVMRDEVKNISRTRRRKRTIQLRPVYQQRPRGLQTLPRKRNQRRSRPKSRFGCTIDLGCT